MALNTSNLGSAFLHRTETNTPEQQSDKCETIRDNFPLEVSLQYLVDSNIVQIDSPDRLPDALRCSYIIDKRELVLLTRDKRAHGAGSFSCSSFSRDSGRSRISCRRPCRVLVPRK